jgi:hypothetical protein
MNFKVKFYNDKKLISTENIDVETIEKLYNIIQSKDDKTTYKIVEYDSSIQIAFYEIQSLLSINTNYIFGSNLLESRKLQIKKLCLDFAQDEDDLTFGLFDIQTKYDFQIGIYDLKTNKFKLNILVGKEIENKINLRIEKLTDEYNNKIKYLNNLKNN